MKNTHRILKEATIRPRIVAKPQCLHYVNTMGTLFSMGPEGMLQVARLVEHTIFTIFERAKKITSVKISCWHFVENVSFITHRSIVYLLRTYLKDFLLT